MINLNEKKTSIFSLYFSSGLTLLGASILEIILSSLLWFRLSIPLTLMVLIYWNVATPRNTGFFWTMFSGFILDLYLGYFLGILRFFIALFWDFFYLVVTKRSFIVDTVCPNQIFIASATPVLA